MFINPISYPGNKNQVLGQIVPAFAKDCSSFVDVFGGCGVVGVNSGYKDVLCNDINEYSIEVLRYFYEHSFEEVIDGLESIIKAYGLTYSRVKPKGYYIEHRHEGLSLYNKEGYLRLKDDYNREHDTIKLIALLIYGFNHYLRFNRAGQFNVPVGKVDLSASIYDNLKAFIPGIKPVSLSFSNLDFRDSSLYTDKDAFFYFDPPYLVTSAPYNVGWSEAEERDLLSLLSNLNARGSKFALSNVLLSNGKVNHLLKEWSEHYRVIPVRRQYRHANYQKKNITDTEEVLVVNY